MFLNAILHSEILLKFHQKCGFFKYLTFNLVCLSQKWCILTKIHYIGTYMMCSKEKATFGPIFDQVLQALINTLGPQCTAPQIILQVEVLQEIWHPDPWYWEINNRMVQVFIINEIQDHITNLQVPAVCQVSTPEFQCRLLFKNVKK